MPLFYTSRLWSLHHNGRHSTVAALLLKKKKTHTQSFPKHNINNNKVSPSPKRAPRSAASLARERPRCPARRRTFEPASPEASPAGPCAGQLADGPGSPGPHPPLARPQAPTAPAEQRKALLLLPATPGHRSPGTVMLDQSKPRHRELSTITIFRRAEYIYTYIYY